MFNKIKISFRMLGVAIRYMKRDPELIFYTILSIIAETFILISFAIIGYFSGITNLLGLIENSYLANAVNIFIIFFYYFIFSIIVFFFNTAIITSVQRRLTGKDNKFSDGINDAFKNMKKIIIWAFVNATVSTILKLIQNKFGEKILIGSLIVRLIGGMWNILTYFSFPLMILEDKSVKESISESASLFKKTWGERAILNVSVGFAVYITIILLIIIFFSLVVITAGSGNFGLLLILFFLFFISIIFLSIFTSTATSIINVIILNYAKTGKLSGVMKLEDILQITKQKEQKV